VVAGISAIPKLNMKSKCRICRDENGACIKCHVKECQHVFHPLCARDAGLHMVASRVDKEDCIAFCPKHTRELKAGRNAPKDNKQSSQHSCHTCGTSEGQSEDDHMYTCSSCHVSVHQKCYFIKPGTMRMDWQCDLCLVNPRGSETKCVICSYAGGAMVRCEGKSGNWAHVACALWMPGTRVGQAGTIHQSVTPASQRKQQDLYCLCRKPYEEGVLMVGCDDCNNWFHPRCVGISEKKAEELDFYQCPGCRGDAPSSEGMGNFGGSPSVLNDVLALPGIDVLDNSIMQLEEDEDLLQLGSALGGIDSMNSPDFDFDAMTVPAERRGKRDRGWSPEPMDDVEGMGSPKRKRR